MRLPLSIATPDSWLPEDWFDIQTERFLDWFKDFPGTTFSDSIKIFDLRSQNAGRGIVATRDIPSDTVLITIPRSMIIRFEGSHLEEKLKPFLAEMPDEKPEKHQESWSLMILVMCYEYFQDKDSRFWEYLAILPESFDTPMFWSEAELAELQASPTRGKIGKEAAEVMFREKIIPLLVSYASLFPKGSWSIRELTELAHRMASLIMAYAFDFEKEDEEDGQAREGDDEWEEDDEDKIRTTMGMVPMADILNADAEFNVHVAHEPECLTVRSLRTIKAGEELLNYYGPHPNSELLRRYGYVTPKHSRHDVVEIPWTTIEAAVVTVLNLSPEQAAKAGESLKEKMDEEGDEMENVFVLERQYDDINPDGTFPGPAAFTRNPEDLDAQLKTYLKILRKMDASLTPEKRKRDHLVAAIMLKALGEVEACYTTSAVEDEQLLFREDLDRRLGMAITVRLGEKKLVREAMRFYAAAAAAEEDGDVDMEGDEGGHKRARRD